ncbi:putative DNA-binding domain-containing protein [Pseudobacteriovorax antillogorgiicola]|nr:putative DNA-binding domain-containing protein [Pseudobacteriovorax antillogorgiicola]
MSTKQLELHPYIQNYLFNHLDALKEAFPATYRFLGENNFKYFGRLYLLDNPPGKANIDLYGEDFPEFLGKQDEFREMVYLKDIAAIDYLWFLQNTEEATVRVADGTLNLWRGLVDEVELEEIEIDTNQPVDISCHWHQGELVLAAQLVT